MILMHRPNLSTQPDAGTKVPTPMVNSVRQQDAVVLLAQRNYPGETVGVIHCAA
jgi:hypothetical protein